MPQTPAVPLAPPLSMKMNGVAREYSAVLGRQMERMQIPTEQPKPMIDIQAFSNDGLILMLWSFATTPGTYPCTTDQRVELFMLTNDVKRFDPPVTFGGFLATENCELTLTQYTPPALLNQGRAIGSFHGEIKRTTGSWPVDTIKITDGRFDVAIQR